MLEIQNEIANIILCLFYVQYAIQVSHSKLITYEKYTRDPQTNPECSIFHLPYYNQIGSATQSIIHRKLVDTVAECANLCAKYRSCVSALLIKSGSWRHSSCYLTEDTKLCPSITITSNKYHYQKSKRRRSVYCIECLKMETHGVLVDDDGVRIEDEPDEYEEEEPPKSNLIHYIRNWTKVSTEFEVERKEKEAQYDSIENTLEALMKDLPGPSVQTKQGSKSRLRFITFNTWRSGSNVNDGLQKVAKHIGFHNPDVVCLQEMYMNKIDDLMKILGPVWSVCKKTSPEQINYIITQHEIIEQYDPAIDVINNGCRIKLSNSKEINVWNVHLHWDTYGPYAACNRGVNSLVTLLYCEYSLGSGKDGRMQNLYSLINHKSFVQNLVQTERDIPLIMAGDFNSPSHLDWTNETANAHCGWTFDWPVSTTMMNYGFTDSYRETNPDPLRDPGNTWSPIAKYLDNWNMLLPEPQDRIDFVYYKGSSLHALYSTEYHGNRPLAIAPGAKENDWPSDHSAVITEFEIE